MIQAESAEVCILRSHLSNFAIHANLSGLSNFRAQGEREIAGGREDLSA
jgi:hypothetical protein